MTAPTAPNYGTSNTEGVDFTTTYTVSATTPELPGPPMAAGQIVHGTNGSEYMFIRASTALKAYQCVCIDTTSGAAVPATAALVNQKLSRIGFPQVAIAAADYGWAAIRGQNIGVLAKKNFLANAKLYVSGLSPGVLSSTSLITSAYVSGVTLTTSCTSAMLNPVTALSAPVVAVATWPRSMPGHGTGAA